MRKSNLISGVLLLVFSIALLFWIIPWQVEETFGGEVSPRLLPQICAIGISILSIILILNNWKPTGGQDAPSPISWSEARAMLIIATLLGLGIVTFATMGPIPASLLLIIGAMAAMGERRPLPYILIPTVLMIGSYVLFYKILGTAIV